MYFKMKYSSEKFRKSTHRFMYITRIYIDLAILFFLNIILFVILVGLRELISKITSLNISFFSFVAIGIIIIIAELISVFIIEAKRSDEYVRIDHRGVYIYTGTGETFGYFSLNPMGLLITFDKIKGFYCGIPYNMPKDFSYIYRNSFDFVKSLIGKNKTILSSQKLIPAIPNGNYDEECILLELENGRTAVIPTSECQKLINYLSQYLEKYNELENS